MSIAACRTRRTSAAAIEMRDLGLDAGPSLHWVALVLVAAASTISALSTLVTL